MEGQNLLIWVRKINHLWSYLVIRISKLGLARNSMQMMKYLVGKQEKRKPMEKKIIRELFFIFPLSRAARSHFLSLKRGQTKQAQNTPILGELKYSAAANSSVLRKCRERTPLKQFPGEKEKQLQIYFNISLV